MTEQVWWAVARSEEISADKPINVNIGDQPVVLWRDQQGVARALEDRCPHRRAPLSLGCVLGNGAIQCGYHGWTFDGASGQLIDIPNLKSDRKYPPVYKAKAFGVAEADGLVRVCLDKKSALPEPLGETLPLSGNQDVAIEHEQFVAALFDDPSLVLAIRGVTFTPYLMSELALQDGRLVLERSCQWSAMHWPSPFSAEFPITLRISTDPVSAESELLLRDENAKPLLRALVAPVPGTRGVTQVRWRAGLVKPLPGLFAKAMNIGSPFQILPHVDGAALRVLRPSASIHAADLRQQLAANTSPAVEAA